MNRVVKWVFYSRERQWRQSGQRPPTKSCPGKKDFFLDKQIQYPGEQLISHTKCVDALKAGWLCYTGQPHNLSSPLEHLWAWDGSLNKASDITSEASPASPFPGFRCAGCPLQRQKDNAVAWLCFWKRCVSLFRFSAWWPCFNQTLHLQTTFLEKVFLCNQKCVNMHVFKTGKKYQECRQCLALLEMGDRSLKISFYAFLPMYLKKHYIYILYLKCLLLFSCFVCKCFHK